MAPTYPAPLRTGDLIAVTAPSSGVAPPLHPRLDRVLAHLRAQGFRVEEGHCLRDERGDASAPADARAGELAALLLRDDVAAIIPPWGGELAIELLDRLPWAALRSARPKWLLGYSDTSTWLVPVTLRLGWATAHGPCLNRAPFDAVYIEGRLIGGCLDTLVHIAGSEVDVDIGHRPPQFTLVNGALATVTWSAQHGGRLAQRLS